MQSSYPSIDRPSKYSQEQVGYGGFPYSAVQGWNSIEYSLPDVRFSSHCILELANNEFSCWDGKNLDSPDHKSHVAYPSGGPAAFSGTGTGGACPSTHPVKIPQIMLEVHISIGTMLNDHANNIIDCLGYNTIQQQG